MRTLSCLMVLAALGLPASALAQMGASKSGMAAVAAFKSLDRDGDGGLTRAELSARGKEKGGAALFAMLDGDGDGRLALKEFIGTPNGGLIGRFDAYDADKNGFVTAKEFPPHVDPLLVGALDRDRDGRVSLAEFRPAFAGSRAARAAGDPAARKLARAEERPRSWCWVTGFGDNDWTLEAPVVWGHCRTR